MLAELVALSVLASGPSPRPCFFDEVPTPDAPCGDDTTSEPAAAPVPAPRLPSASEVDDVLRPVEDPRLILARPARLRLRDEDDLDGWRFHGLVAASMMGTGLGALAFMPISGRTDLFPIGLLVTVVGAAAGGLGGYFLGDAASDESTVARGGIVALYAVMATVCLAAVVFVAVIASGRIFLGGGQ